MHRTKDVTFSEDASLTHAGQGPTVMALVRDAAVSVLQLTGVTRISARRRWQSQHTVHAVALVVKPLATHA